MLYRRGKDEEHKVYDMQREHDVQLATERQRNDDLQEDLDMQNERVLRLEEENKKMRV